MDGFHGFFFSHVRTGIYSPSELSGLGIITGGWMECIIDSVFSDHKWSARTEFIEAEAEWVALAWEAYTDMDMGGGVSWWELNR